VWMLVGEIPERHFAPSLNAFRPASVIS
jgi:hypothetical protein